MQQALLSVGSDSVNPSIHKFVVRTKLKKKYRPLTHALPIQRESNGSANCTTFCCRSYEDTCLGPHDATAEPVKRTLATRHSHAAISHLRAALFMPRRRVSRHIKAAGLHNTANIFQHQRAVTQQFPAGPERLGYAALFFSSVPAGGSECGAVRPGCVSVTERHLSPAGCGCHQTADTSCW